MNNTYKIILGASIAFFALSSCEKTITLTPPETAVKTYVPIADTTISNIKYTNYAVQFINEKIGWSSTSVGRILKTSNGGTTWEVQKSNLTIPTGTTALPNILALNMVDATTGYAVGATGTILKTSDGINWLTQKSGSVLSINAVHFYDKNIGTCVSNTGGILTTSDGGTTWTAQKSGVTVNLLGVKYLNATTIYVVGATGTLLKSVDTGKTWTNIATGITTNLLALQLPSANVGYACGNSGVIVKIDLTKATVKQLLYGQDDTVRGLFFLDEKTGYVVGNYGQVGKTEDGGITWTSQNINPVAYSMYGISFPVAKTGYLVGARIAMKIQL